MFLICFGVASSFRCLVVYLQGRTHALMRTQESKIRIQEGKNEVNESQVKMKKKSQFSYDWFKKSLQEDVSANAQSKLWAFVKIHQQADLSKVSTSLMFSRFYLTLHDPRAPWSACHSNFLINTTKEEEILNLSVTLCCLIVEMTKLPSFVHRDL